MQDDDGRAIRVERSVGNFWMVSTGSLVSRKNGKAFDLPVTVFPTIEIADQAYIFATVNIAQTKVNSSLAYDLLAYARSRSPEQHAE